MKLVDQTQTGLVNYLEAQCASLIPDEKVRLFRGAVTQFVPEALERLNRCINACAPWKPNQFNYLHSSQYCIFLYYLANTIWRRTQDPMAPTRLFLMNKALNGIDLFYEIEMPEVFYIGHSVGIVLAKATYGNYLVLYQNVNVGRHIADIPTIGDRVILYPGSSVVGSSAIGDGAVLSQGVKAINKTVPAGNIAFTGEGGDLVYKPAPQDLLKEYFRL
jgi:serine O-acetyltransferase